VSLFAFISGGEGEGEEREKRRGGERGKGGCSLRNAGLPLLPTAAEERMEIGRGEALPVALREFDPAHGLDTLCPPP